MRRLPDTSWFFAGRKTLLNQELAPQYSLGLSGGLMLEKASKSVFGGLGGCFGVLQGLAGLKINIQVNLFGNPVQQDIACS